MIRSKRFTYHGELVNFLNENHIQKNQIAYIGYNDSTWIVIYEYTEIGC